MAAELLSNFIWRGLDSELPTDEEGAKDGHLYKSIDVGKTYIRRDGVWEDIGAGLSLSPPIKAGALTTDSNGECDVIFNTPFNEEYSILLSTKDQGAVKPPVAFFDDVTSAGFHIQTRESRSGQPCGNSFVSWLAVLRYNPIEE